METFAVYLFRSVIWLTGFALVYLLFLRNERFFLLKRAYLVSGIIVSLFFPLISIHYPVEMPAPASNASEVLQAGISPMTAISQSITGRSFDYRIILLLLYLSGVLFLGYRLIHHMGLLYKAINRAGIKRKGPAKLVRISGFQASFSFFNYVFINPSIDEAEVEEIMNHELVHVRQKHWLDLFLVEMLRLFQWINPFVWIYTGFIRLNHEYMADEAALQRTTNPANYRAALLNQLFRSPVISLSNSFNYSLNKKRFDMMKKIISSPYRKLKVLLILPVFAIVLYAFATPEYHYIPSTESNNDALTIYVTPPIVQKEVKGIVLNKEGKPLKGVNITATGTMGNASVVTTGTDGRFSLINVQGDATLLIFCRGYKQLTLKPVFTSEMKIIMETGQEYQAPAAQRPNPVVAIDGVISEKAVNDARKDLGYDFGIGKLITGKEATDKYGERGVNGVYEIITRKKALEMGLKPPFPRLAPDDYPTFQGQSYQGFASWVRSRIIYPAEAQAQKLEGWVTINFTVELDGTVSNIGSSREANPPLSNEVIRVIQSAPKWDPPKNPDVDQPFTSRVTLKFKLPDYIIEDEPFVVVEQMPVYPGGEGVLLNFIATNAKYPEAAKAEKIEGKVVIRFIVNTEGYAEDATVLRGVHPLLDAEAVRVVSMLSGFTPGMQGGRAVNVWYMVPVNFSLPKEEIPK